MRLNTGIITDKLEETKSFYVDKLGFSILWEADWFILLATPNGADTISFLVPNHPTQELLYFRKPFNGNGIYFTIEVENVDIYFEELKKTGIDIALNIRSEEWGDRHFAVIDPNNIGIDFVTHTKTE
ncbi:MAG: VOC family protein [Saprospiraceae bacterium]|nr:VOC family protein [Saprospiraceae bacterium]